MPRKKKTSGNREYRRENGRYHIDLRSYADVLDGKTGKHVALVAPGEKVGTKDRDVALKLAATMIQEVEDRRRGKVMGGRGRAATLGEFAGRYLVLKKRDGQVADGLLQWAERVALPRAISFFGADRPLQSVDVQAVRAWIYWLYTKGHRGTTLSGQTVRHHLNLVSNLYRYAQQEGLVPPGFNPVSLLMVKPTGARREARWLEINEAARFLAAAKDHAADHYEVFATCSSPVVARARFSDLRFRTSTSNVAWCASGPTGIGG